MSKRRKPTPRISASCLASSVLPDAGRPGEQEAADRPLGLPQPGAVHLDRLRHARDRRVLPEDLAAQVGLQVLQPLAIVGRRPAAAGCAPWWRRPSRCPCARRARLPPSACGRPCPCSLSRGARLVDQIDRLVGQLAVGQVARRQLGRRLQRFVGVGDAVELLVARAQPLQHLDRLLDRRLLDLDGLEAPRQRAVLLDVAAELLVRGRADAAQLPVRQRRLEQVGRVHRAARRRARADDGVQLVDEDDRVLLLLQRRDHRLEALLEVAAVARPRHHRSHVERVDDRARAAPPAPRPARCARASPSTMAVLPTPASPMNSGLFLRRRASTCSARSICGSAADQRIDLARARPLVQVDRVLRQRIDRRLLVLVVADRPGAPLPRQPGRLGRQQLGDAVRDVADHVQPRDPLFLEERARRANRARRTSPPARSAPTACALPAPEHVVDRALDDARERQRRLRPLALRLGQRLELGLQERLQLAAEPRHRPAALLDHVGGLLVVEQRQQQVLERGELVTAPGRVLQRVPDGGFQLGRQHQPCS